MEYNKFETSTPTLERPVKPTNEETAVKTIDKETVIENLKNQEKRKLQNLPKQIENGMVILEKYIDLLVKSPKSKQTLSVLFAPVGPQVSKLIELCESEKVKNKDREDVRNNFSKYPEFKNILDEFKGKLVDFRDNIKLMDSPNNLNKNYEIIFKENGTLTYFLTQLEKLAENIDSKK